MKSAHAHLFADIAWSTDSVAEATRNRASELGLEMLELPGWYDVDDGAALDRLLMDPIAGGGQNGLVPYAAPATARALARFGLRSRDLDQAAE
jgi:hypothetical protein